MKKSFLCILLALCFVLPLVIAPAYAFAEENEAVLVEQTEGEPAEAPAEQESQEIEESPAVEQEEPPEEAPEDPEPMPQIELELNKRIELDPDGIGLYFFPKESGDYQMWLELAPEWDWGSLAMGTDDLSALNMSGSDGEGYYDNISMTAGCYYSFATLNYSAVTLTKNTVPEIGLGDNPGRAGGYQYLNVFVPAERGRYTFTRTGYSIEPEYQGFVLGVKSTGKYYGSFDDKNSWDMVLEEGDRCYISSRDAKNINIKKEGYNDVPQDIERAYLLEEPWYFGEDGGVPEDKTATRFTIDNNKAVMKAYSGMKQPWIAVVPQQETAVPVLKDSNGKVIPWQEKRLASYETFVYMAPVNTLGGKRSFTLSILPEDGNAQNAKDYKLYINPELKKPGRPTITKCETKIDVPVIEWSKVPDATGYYVYRADKKEGTYKKIATLDRAGINGFTDSSVEMGARPYYKVVAYTKGNGKTLRGDSSKAVRCKGVQS